MMDLMTGQSDQTTDYKIGNVCFSGKKASLSCIGING
jgi:hypothetical protein